MDLALRTLRDGPGDGAAAPLLLLLDEVALVGGPALLRQAVAELAAAIAAGRAHATSLTIVALERPAAHYQQLCSLASASLTILDCCTDPYGWGSIPSSSGGCGGCGGGGSHSSSSVLLPGILAAPDGIQQLQQRLCSLPAAGGRQQCVIIDCLSPLIDRFGAGSVALLLHSLQAAAAAAAAGGTSCLLCALHADLHPPADLAAVEQLAAGTMQLEAVSELERDVCKATHGAGSDPQGRLSVRLKRKAGRVRAEAQLYCIDGSGTAAFMELPADLLNPQAAAEKAVAAAAAAAAAGTGAESDAAAAGALVAQQLAGGMKLSLSQAEQEARQRVQLPFEHQGRGSAYQTGDFRDYLPPEAGGRPRLKPAAGVPAADSMAAAAEEQLQQPQKQPFPVHQQQRLGHILYVRDSGSEHDSDEDPDDDLDI